MATSRVSPLRRQIQLSATSQSQSLDRPTVPKYHARDPLLGNLSPESTLQALSSINAVPKNEQAAHDILTRSISKVSPAERALGVRAAVAAQKLGVWYKEIQTWEWPKRSDIHLGKGFIPPAHAESENYWGSLPGSVVEEHENRIEEIRDGMESLNVEELKEHVLNAHIPARSRPSSSNSTISIPPPLSYVQLSDFTAVITATILRTLPILSRLNSLLSTWSVRLLVLRQIPALLQSLQLARSELDFALRLLKSSDPPVESDSLYCISNYHAKRANLESTVVSTGRRMDRILDALEGREDSLPENWIDDLEAIESDFGNWVVAAEKHAVRNEWRRMTAPKKTEAQEPVREFQQLTEPENVPEPVIDTPNPQPDITQPTMAPSVIFSQAPDPEPRQHEPQNELAALQAGPTTPMETIAEESGNYFEQPPSTPTKAVTIIQEIANPCDYDLSTASSNSKPEIPKAAPKLDQNPITSIDAACKLSTSPDYTLEENIKSQVVADESPDDEPPVEEPSSPMENYNEDSVIIQPMGTTSFSSSDDVASSFSAESACLNGESPEDLQSTTKFETRSASFVPVEPTEVEQPSEVLSTTPPATPPPKVPSLIQLDAKTPVSLKTLESPPLHETAFPSVKTQHVSEELEPIAELEDFPLPSLVENEPATPPGVYAQPTLTTQPGPVSAIPKELPSTRSLSPLLESPNLFVSFDSSKASPASHEPEAAEKTNESPVPRQPLESPIKLSKSRPGRLDLDKQSSRPRGRRSSNASAGSMSDDYPSLVSSPERHEPRTGSSNGTPIILETPPHYPADYQPSEPAPPNNDHILREDRLFRLDSQKTYPREAFSHNRTLSLPLQRFINERLELNYENEPSVDEDSFVTGKGGPNHSAQLPGQKHRAVRRQKGRSFTPTNNMRHLASQHLALTREESSGPESDGSNGEQSKTQELNQKAISTNSARGSPRVAPPANLKTARLRKQLTTHPSLESIGAYRSNNRFTKDTTATPNFEKLNSRSSTPSNHLIRPNDEMDEKINSILTTLSTRIHLVPADQDTDTRSVASSLPFKGRERLRSHSPQGTPSRSSTPTPSLTLRPAVSRRRHSHAYSPEESSVKLYHLHGGGKSAPTKLFVRSVGENGERVMVRVGGGWADLGEYLREYAIHHGRRHVSETPRVEVDRLSNRESPSYSPPGSKLTSSGNGRHTPSRPRSVLSNRPSSSLAVRKTRRASNVSDMGDLRAASARAVSAGDALNLPISPMSSVFPRRRMSVSSNISMGAVSSVSEIRHGSPSGPAVPLGLAGPKPRAKHVSISPESEAWVEDVLGQARRSSSLRPFKYGTHDQEPAEANSSGLPKARSISDIGKAGSSKRVALRGLGSR